MFRIRLRYRVFENKVYRNKGYGNKGYEFPYTLFPLIPYSPYTLFPIYPTNKHK
jgi:hypothetical protein